MSIKDIKGQMDKLMAELQQEMAKLQHLPTSERMEVEGGYVQLGYNFVEGTVAASYVTKGEAGERTAYLGVFKTVDVIPKAVALFWELEKAKLAMIGLQEAEGVGVVDYVSSKYESGEKKPDKPVSAPKSSRK